jgi:hypothetical protein
MPGPIPKNNDNGGEGAPKDQNPAGAGTNTPTPPNGSEPKKTDTGRDASVDLSTLNDEAFGKVFDDPRLWKHPRFKQLSERAKEAADLKAEKEAAETKRLEEEKKFEELADKKGQEAAKWKTRYEEQIVSNQIISAASKLGTVDPDAVNKLVDRSLIKVTDDGVTGIEAAVMALKELKPYLFGEEPSKSLGSGSNPSDANTGAKFKASELADPAFYREHEQEIMEAMKVPGSIINDLG